MNAHAGVTRSVWMEAGEALARGALGGDLSTEICIVGAGISGLTTAYLLGLAGKQVVVIDDGPIAAGETERTTAHLSSALDDRFYWLERLHGENGARVAAQSHAEAILAIERIVRHEGIQCGFHRLNGFLFLPPGASLDELHNEHGAAKRAGLESVTMLDQTPLGSFNAGPCLQFPDQGQFHPLEYLRGLTRAITQQGGLIHTNTRGVEIEDGRPVSVRTEAGARITCAAVVVATNTPINDRVAVHSKQAAYRTYAVGGRVRAGSVPLGLYWDTAQDAESAGTHGAPYHYIRLQPMGSHDLLIVGGEDHKTGQANDGEARWDRLKRWTVERFPMVESFDYKWSGQVMEPVDGMAYIGRNPGEQNVYIATGDSGHGMTHGTIAGVLLTDLILGRPNAWAELYDPGRVRFKSVGEYVRENLNVAGKYGEYVTAGEVSSEADIPPDSGAVVQRGLSKIAVYRDEAGRCHELSAVCTHLKCIVHWNAAEKSWDCPCHGSRFTRYGEVVNGPAYSGLAPLESAREEKEAA